MLFAPYALVGSEDGGDVRQLALLALGSSQGIDGENVDGTGV